jgi:glutamine amidotransferase
MLAVDPGLFAEIIGSTDTEAVFHLALTLGPEKDPVDALERRVGHPLDRSQPIPTLSVP